MDNVIAKRVLRGTWVCIVLIAIFFSIYWLTPLVYPFLIAWLIAYAMNPFVHWLRTAIKLPKWLSVLIGLMIYWGAAAIVLTAAITRLLQELIHLAETLDVHLAEWRKWFIDWSQSDGIQKIIREINTFVANNPGYSTTITKNIDNTAATIGSAVSRIVTVLLSGIINLIASLPGLGVIVSVILLATFFISNNWDKNMTILRGIIPAPFRQTSGEVWRDLQKAFFGYLRAQFILISITASIVFIGLVILHVDSPFTYAILIGAVDLLPYLGVGTIMAPWLLYAFMTGDIQLGIGLSILYGIILVARQLIEPKILASNVGIEPLPTLISMFVGMKLFGVLGLIIGPVSLVVFGAISRAGVLHDLRNYILSGRLR
ncbi:sporulation integral membrane protein YtvI [Paenibacillus anaericanus]|uniref:sporulation integral membrane protein YtvI n=1 Tax=Paenibacillus anaericanus TaxID=170367 RepID=UPI0027842377|nr:sporulation integral membrane protein YtvI [Paenibacillus anaericanus]MDQ0086997.1 sporulation integral membrane protein YtvI [Paenibacillus anaericanus]